MKIKTKKDKRIYLIVVLVIILLLLAVGYAAFADSLTISGNVSGTVKYDIHFDPTSTGTIGLDGKTLTADVTLDCPGDVEEIIAVVKNDSSIPVEFTGFKVTAPEDVNNITFSVSYSIAEGTVLEPGETYTYPFTIKWKEESEATSVSGTYKFEIQYEQAAEIIEHSASHSNTYAE